MFNANNYGYNPYGTYIPQRPMQRPVEQPFNSVQTRSPLNVLNGKQVDSLEVVKALDIPLDGSISYFPLANGSAIVTKQLQQDGTSKITIYEPKQEKQTIKYVTMDDLKEKIEDFNVLESQLEDLRKEIKEIKSKLKPKKEK